VASQRSSNLTTFSDGAQLAEEMANRSERNAAICGGGSWPPSGPGQGGGKASHCGARFLGSRFAVVEGGREAERPTERKGSMCDPVSALLAIGVNVGFGLVEMVIEKVVEAAGEVVEGVGEVVVEVVESIAHPKHAGGAHGAPRAGARSSPAALRGAAAPRRRGRPLAHPRR
jgi:hypothetical protein